MAPEKSKKLEKSIKNVIPINEVHFWQLPTMIIWAVGKGAAIATIAPTMSDE